MIRNPLKLILGSWQESLKRQQCDALICDPPYGKRTHLGHNSGAAQANRNGGRRTQINYTAWGYDDVFGFVEAWAPRTRGWMVAFTSHDLIEAWQSAYRQAGRMAFAPVACVSTGSTVRLTGDGPANWTTYLMVSRPRGEKWRSWGALPGAYTLRAPFRKGGAGRKPLALMRRIVMDYSRRGDLVCDPLAGYGTTLVAAALAGRRALGCEINEKTFMKAQELIMQDMGRARIKGGAILGDFIQRDMVTGV